MFELWFREATFFRNALMVFFMHVVFTEDANQGKHILHYQFTALSGASSFPEFSAAAVADDRRVAYCTFESKLWVQTEEEHTLTHTHALTNTHAHTPISPPDSRTWMMLQIRALAHCAHTHCSDLHVLQRIIGCELEKFPNGSQILIGFDEYGFDGEDFIAFNSDTKKWTEKNPKAKETKKKWDRQTGRNQFISYYLKTCMSWIYTYNNTRKIRPNVHVFVKKAPDDHSKQILTCLATGFYPKDIKVRIRLNKTIIEDQESSGVRPNHDRSFQIRNSLKIDRNKEGFYDCVVAHSSLTDEILVKQAGAGVDCENESVSSVISGVTGALFTVGFIVIVCLIYRKKSFNGIVKLFYCNCGRKKMLKEKNSLNPSLTEELNVCEHESAVKTETLMEER